MVGCKSRWLAGEAGVDAASAAQRAAEQDHSATHPLGRADEQAAGPPSPTLAGKTPYACARTSHRPAPCCQCCPCHPHAPLAAPSFLPPARPTPTPAFTLCRPACRTGHSYVCFDAQLYYILCLFIASARGLPSVTHVPQPWQLPVPTPRVSQKNGQGQGFTTARRQAWCKHGRLHAARVWRGAGRGWVREGEDMLGVYVCTLKYGCGR
jgi:hypothetical protein